MIDELYERIADLRSQLYWKQDVEDLVREMLLHSTISIEECEKIFYFLNLPQDNIKKDFLIRKYEDELFKALEMI